MPAQPNQRLSARRRSFKWHAVALVVPALVVAPCVQLCQRQPECLTEQLLFCILIHMSTKLLKFFPPLVSAVALCHDALRACLLCQCLASVQVTGITGTKDLKCQPYRLTNPMCTPNPTSFLRPLHTV